MAEETTQNEQTEETSEEARPRLVSGPAYDREVGREEAPEAAPSAAKEFVAQPWDGRDGDEEGEVLPADKTRKAFEAYVQRADIESREAILARENALPGQFQTVYPTADEKVVEDAAKNRDKNYDAPKS